MRLIRTPRSCQPGPRECDAAPRSNLVALHHGGAIKLTCLLEPGQEAGERRCVVLLKQAVKRRMLAQKPSRAQHILTCGINLLLCDHAELSHARQRLVVGELEQQPHRYGCYSCK